MQTDLEIGLYCRVSTDEQAQQGFSIESQKARLEAFCQSQGWSNYQFYIDDGYSGTHLNRPALGTLIADIKVGKIAGVLVYRLDRLGRKQKDVLHLLEDIFEPHHVVFRSATEPFDTSTSFGKAMLGMLAVFAQLERDTIIERTTLGRRQRIKEGLWPGGRSPFGYRWDPLAQQLCLVPEEAIIVKRVYQLFLSGESLTGISRWLSMHSTSRKWTHTFVREMLSRPVYMGAFRTDETLVTGCHEAIVNEEMWGLAQNELATRRRNPVADGHYLLSGLLYCGVCGEKMIHIHHTGKRLGRTYTYEYYGCKRQHQQTRGAIPYCNLGFKRKEVLETKIIEALFNLQLDAQLIYSESQTMNSDIGNMRQNHNNTAKAFSNKLHLMEAKLQRWYQAFEEGTLSPQVFTEHVQALEQEKAALILSLQEAEAPLANLPADELPADLIRTAWPTLTVREQQTLLRLAIRKITVFKTTPDIVIEWNLKEPSRVQDFP